MNAREAIEIEGEQMSRRGELPAMQRPIELPRGGAGHELEGRTPDILWEMS